MLMQVLLLQDLDKFVMLSVDIVPHPYRGKIMGLLLGTGVNSGHGLLKISAKRLTKPGLCSWKTGHAVEQCGLK